MFAVSPVLLALTLAMSIATTAAPPEGEDIRVHIERGTDAIEVDVLLVVAATPQEVWSVLTDYEHMADFVSNVAMSTIRKRDGDRLEVAQTSRLAFGPFQLTFDNVREIELVPPREIRSTLIEGDMMPSAFTTRIAADGGVTRVTNHGRFTIDRWIPPLIGTAVLEAQTRKQFAEFRAEILRRKEENAANRR